MLKPTVTVSVVHAAVIAGVVAVTILGEEAIDDHAWRRATVRAAAAVLSITAVIVVPALFQLIPRLGSGRSEEGKKKGIEVPLLGASVMVGLMVLTIFALAVVTDRPVRSATVLAVMSASSVSIVIGFEAVLALIARLAERPGGGRLSRRRRGRTAGQKLDQLVDAPRERHVTSIPQDKHLKNVPELDVGDVVHPFRGRPEVPELPEKTAGYAAQTYRDGGLPLSPTQLLRQVASPAKTDESV